MSFFATDEHEKERLHYFVLPEASLKMLKVEKMLSRGWGGKNAYHVREYRYLLVDGDKCRILTVYM
ncbi:hypothetical protein ACS0TY_029187 [Phlomoides rotata]